MASSSSIHKTSFKYDVFLSFRGEDTRTSFVDHLYHALKLENIETYKDDKNLEKGKKISKELIQAIEESRFHVVVFSKNYASSSWCLDELVKIMECQETPTDHNVYPIFYDVEPTHVRKQSGEFGQAFSKHTNDENADKWRKALVEATSLSGRELRTTADGHEAEFIKLVVKDISSKLPTVYADGNLIGMRTRIDVVVSSLSTFPNEICMIGLTGMGGVGKTTLARAVFDHICKEFDGSSFVENVRESSNSLLLGLKSLQQQVLREVLNRQDITVNGDLDGKKKLKKYMPRRKVLLVLDDVDHIDQLKALAGERNWFMKGSRIIITTRDKQVLLAHKVDSIHDVSLLTDEEAICLLSRCAFGTEIPSPGYKELSEKVVSYAAGLPLTITILGSSLCDANEDVWIDTLEELEKIPLDGTLQRLELSYKGLEPNCQEIFLDVACIFKGWSKDEAIRALESRGFHAIRGLSVLEKKSLVTTRYDHLDMHDHLQEMGRYIVRRLHLEEPNKHSRLWIDEEIMDILANDQGTNEAIRCIELVNSKIYPEIVMKGLGNMKQLRFLHVYGKSYFDTDWKFHEFCRYFPDALRWLSWEWYPFRSLPKSFQANNLVALQMRHSKIVELWEDEDRKVLHKLRFLDLSDSKLKNLDLGLTLNLERLSLNGCRDLVELRMPVECPKLIFLHLGASMLTTLDLRGTLNIENLYLIECDDLVELHIPVECLKLESLVIYGSKLRTLDLRGTPNIKELDLKRCVDLVELHIPVECLKLKSVTIKDSKLRTLDLRGTSNIEELKLKRCVDFVELHIPVECLKLKSVTINDSKLRTLDLRGTLNIENLYLIECDDLVELHIPVECLKLESLVIYGSKLRTLDLRGTPNIKELDLKRCVDLVELHIPVECLKLKSVTIKDSKLRTLDLRGTSNIEELKLKRCVDFVELHIPVECLKLKSVTINDSKLRTLDLRGTLNIENLYLIECDDLVELHIPVECLKLESLVIYGSKLRTLDLRGTPNIEEFYLKRCVDLVELHIPVECLKLKSVTINDSKLRTLDLRGTPNIEELDLKRCVDLLELHIPVECLKLKSVTINDSKLRTLDLRGTLNIENLYLIECVDLVELHIPVECLKLVFIYINGSKLRTLDLRGTPNIKELHLEECVDLVELHIPVECLKLESVDIDSSKLRTFDLGLTPNLKKLSLTKCYYLVELHTPVECLRKLSYLNLSGCLRFKSFLCKKRFEAVGVGCLSKLHLIAESLDMCPLHSDNNLPKFQFTCYYEEEEHMVPTFIGDLAKLLSTCLCPCTDLERFSRSICGLQCLIKLTLEGDIPEAPNDLGMLECLVELSVSTTKITHLPESICMLKHLKILKLQSCWCLEKLPEDLGGLECLEDLTLSECIVLRDIPNSICKMRRLKYLELLYCYLVEKLPEDFGCLECLKLLNIEGTGISQLPQSIFSLKGLRIAGFRWLLESFGFASKIHTLGYVTFCHI